MPQPIPFCASNPACDNAQAHNPYARIRRLEKANALIETLILNEMPAALLELADEDQWAQIAEIAGVRMPSAETRRLVIESLRRMEGAKS